jgi:hypothetical protein
MPRPLRLALPGDYFHVINHGQAHAPLFESETDSNRLLALLGWATIQGWIRVLAYAILATHFHLLLQTVDGRLDYAMQRVEGAFGTWHNRARTRVGHVMKARYRARVVLPGVDLAMVLAYIDWNPVAAQMSSTPEAYPHGSAQAYVHGGGPDWLARADVEQLICRVADVPAYDRSLYPKLWTWARRAGASEVAARALRGAPTALADVPILASAGPEHVQRWLREHLAREEGRTKPSLLLSPSALLLRVGDFIHTPSEPLVVGLLRQLCGSSTAEIASLLRISEATALRRTREHRKQMASEGAYAAQAALLTRSALRETYGRLCDVNGDVNGV